MPHPRVELVGPLLGAVRVGVLLQVWQEQRRLLHVLPELPDEHQGLGEGGHVARADVAVNLGAGLEHADGLAQLVPLRVAQSPRPGGAQRMAAARVVVVFHQQRPHPEEREGELQEAVGARRALDKRHHVRPHRLLKSRQLRVVARGLHEVASHLLHTLHQLRYPHLGRRRARGGQTRHDGVVHEAVAAREHRHLQPRHRLREVPPLPDCAGDVHVRWARAAKVLRCEALHPLLHPRGREALPREGLDVEPHALELERRRHIGSCGHRVRGAAPRIVPHIKLQGAQRPLCDELPLGSDGLPNALCQLPPLVGCRRFKRAAGHRILPRVILPETLVVAEAARVQVHGTEDRVVPDGPGLVLRLWSAACLHQRLHGSIPLLLCPLLGPLRLVPPTAALAP
mmetsp:Transcript_21063/g.50280  ORF Transcript_21063/g.50280 Transcript_21063/m.50280 type:complete len:398 (+) Transcript_21063:828-2021(+)